MPYTVSFPTCYPREFYTTRGTPYDHWIACYKPHDATYRYRDHGMAVEYEHMVFIPSLKMLCVDCDFEYYHSNTVAIIDIDDVQKTLHVTKATTNINNDWPEMNNLPRTQVGGGRLLLTASLLEENHNFLRVFATHMFGHDWEVRINPNAPMASKEEEFEGITYLDSALYGKWGQVVCTVYVDIDDAATIIQKWFRGWQARLKYRFDPTNRLGRFCEEKQFRELCI